jgi:hypothetical protein
MDDSDNRTGGNEEAKASKMKAEDNAWYRLATLYGVPEFQNDFLKNKNRIARVARRVRVASVGLGTANTFNVFGFRKDFFKTVAIECLPAASKIIAAVQTIFGTILLFLFGLGVRNKFRMK